MEREFREAWREGPEMPSPFPGMNPYLEQADVWTDFHDRLVPAIADALAAQLDPEYIVKIQEQLYIHEPPAASRRLIGRSDVSVAPGAKGGTATLEAPEEVEVDVTAERISRVEVRDRLKRKLITVIEVLSPANKFAGPDREQYLTKRGELLVAPVHLIEIDLLRGGPRLPVTGVMGPCDYCVLVSRAERRPKAGLWRLGLRDPLPDIPVPLQPAHADAKLDLQGLLHRVYDAARYQTYIYDGLPSPALSPENAAWAEGIVKAVHP